MKINSAKILLIVVAVCFTTVAHADRGVFKKKVNKLHLNLNTSLPLRNSIKFDLKSGLSYKGSTLVNNKQMNSVMFNTSIVSYQKGNTVYIIPFKQKILIPEYSASTGYKLVIRSRK